jgi:hypothetical protein
MVRATMGAERWAEILAWLTEAFPTMDGGGGRVIHLGLHDEGVLAADYLPRGTFPVTDAHDASLPRPFLRDECGATVVLVRAYSTMIPPPDLLALLAEAERPDPVRG